MRARRTALLTVVCLAAALLAANAGDDPFEPYRTLTLGPAGRTVAPVKAHFSNLELDITDGQLFPVVTAAGEVIGFQFSGHGVWRYTIKDREAIQVFRHNSERVSNAFDVGVDQVRDKFTGATVLFTRPAFEELTTGDAAPVPTTSGARDALATTMKLMDVSDVGFEHFAAESRLGDVAGQQMLYAEFDGGEAGRVGFVYDAVRSGTEYLTGFVKNSYGRFNRRIATQKLDGLGKAAWRMEHIDLDLRTADNRSGTIKSVIRVHLIAPGVRVLAFNLENHNNRREYTWRSSSMTLDVTRVVDETGKALAFSHRHHELDVDLGERLPAETVKTLTVETGGDVFTAAGGYRGDKYIDLFLTDWFPQPGPIWQRRYTFTGSFRTKKPFIPVVSGDTVSLSEDGDQWVLTAKSDTPIWSFAAFAGKYETSEVKNERWTVRAHSYGAATKDDRDRVARTAAQFIEIYEKLLGPYPSKELDLVEFPTMSYFGISPSGLIVLTSRWFSPREWKMNQELAKAATEWDAFSENFFSNRGLNAVLAHEIAHQWFGHRAWPLRLGEDAWLDESCAEYVSGLAIGIATQGQKSGSAKIQDFRAKLDDWHSWNDQISVDYSISASPFSNDGNSFQFRTYQLYDRGPLVLHMLRTLVGDERFLKIMRQYLDDAKLGPRTTEDFAASATKVLGMDVGWYFDQWFRDPGTPKVKVVQGVEGTTLKVTLKQAAGAPFKKLHVPFVLTFPDGHREVKLAFQETRTQEFSFPLTAKPAKVEVDPSHNNLVVYE